MKKILVPSDFSDPANNALHLAGQIARRTGAKIFLLHIVEPIKSYVAATDGMYIDASVEEKYIDYLKDNAKDQLKKISVDEEFQGIEMESLVSLGSIFSIINEHVNRYDIDLIVMGTQGVSGLDELLIGSNTEKVVRTAQCPVLTVRGKLEVEQFHKIVFATNFDKKHKIVLGHLKRLKEIFEAEMTILYVNVPNDFHTHREINAKKSHFFEGEDVEGFHFEIYDERNEENGMIHYAEDNQVDMIVVATRQRTGIAHLITGSIAEDVVNHANRPVLTFGLKYLKKLQEV
ncbi:MAG: universal stress protein [Bacteroidota bacterium]